MGELLLNEEGNLVDADGKVFEIDGEPVKVANAQTQEQTNAVIKSRLARQQKTIDDQIKTLQAQADKTPALQKMIDDLEAQRDKLANDLEKAEAQAEEKVSAQIMELKKRTSDAEAALNLEQKSHVNTQVTNAILSSKGASQFIDPAGDVVPKLLQSHKREPVLDEFGKPVKGQSKDVFGVEIPPEEEGGEYRRENVSLDKALEVIAKTRPHWVAPTDTSGSGGGSYKSKEVSKDIDAQIAAAVAKGDWAESIRLKGTKSYEALKK
ncbi:MAG TPA: hypothetical protein VMW24_18740 [Sedimentisphaerales bacterium]|nr:hypothetical protein [Sedimentisphaerales bacterium]